MVELSLRLLGKNPLRQRKIQDFGSGKEGRACLMYLKNIRKLMQVLLREQHHVEFCNSWSYLLTGLLNNTESHEAVVSSGVSLCDSYLSYSSLCVANALTVKVDLGNQLSISVMQWRHDDGQYQIQQETGIIFNSMKIEPVLFGNRLSMECERRQKSRITARWWHLVRQKIHRECEVAVYLNLEFILNMLILMLILISKEQC